ncbi:MAG: C25 family cysteine peptidase [Bacteroidales bacterium]
MRRLLCIVLAFLFGVNVKASEDWKVKYREESKVLQLEFSVANFKLEKILASGKEFSKLNFEGGVVLDKKGFAKLPYVHASLQIDDLSGYKLKVRATEFEEIQLEYPLLPSKGKLTRDRKPSTIPYEVSDASLVDSWYPLELCKTSDPFIFRDIRGINVYFSPFQYNGLKKKLRICKKAVIELVPTKGNGKNPLINKLNVQVKDMKGAYKSIFINSENNTRKKRLSVQENGSILVLTPAKYDEAIQPYITWKIEKGFKVYKEIVPVKALVKENIKKQFKDHNDILYVLLVGDWDDIRSETNGVIKNVPTDPMLGCVVGDDYYPDLSVGRFSINSPEELGVMVNKVINYEKNPQGDFYKSALHIASSEGPGDDGEIDFEHQEVIWNEKLSKFTYNDQYTCYEPDDKKEYIRKALSDGVGIINYCGHGNKNTWVTSGFDISEVNNLSNNNMLPFIISVACNNGDFFYGGDCFAEAWTKKKNGGAIAMLASTIAQPWDPPLRGQDYFNDLLTGGFNYEESETNGTSTTEGRTTFGSLVTNAFVLMYSESNALADLETIQTWTTFGDPSLQVRTDIAKPLTISNNLIIKDQIFSAQVTSKGQVVENALVSISGNGKMFSAYTDANGNVNINHSFQSGEVKLVVTGFNLNTIYNTQIVHTGEEAIVALDKLYGSNNEQKLNVGEQVDLSLDITNKGKKTAENIVVELSSKDPNITVLNSTLTVSSLESLELKKIEKAFKVKVAGDLTNGHIVQMRFDILSDAFTNTVYKSFVVRAPEINLKNNFHFENMEGEEISFLQKKSTVKFIAEIENIGELPSDSFTIELKNDESGLKIINSQRTIDEIPGKTVETIIFNLEIEDKYFPSVLTKFYLLVGFGDKIISEEIPIRIDPIIETFESQDFSKLEWVMQGDADWIIDSPGVNKEGFCARSGKIKDNQTSALTLNYNCVGSDYITFFVKTSCEPSYDMLKFYIDNLEHKISWSGKNDWVEVKIDITEGNHTFKWEYEKDGYQKVGEDAVWIDRICFPRTDNRLNVVVPAMYSSEFEVFPNPIDDYMTITLNSENNNKPIQMEIYNVNGQIVGSNILNCVKGKNRFRLDMGQYNLKSGVYFCRIKLRDKLLSKKIIKL